MQAHIRDTHLFFDVDGAGLVPDGSRMRERHTAVLIHGGPGTDHTSGKARYCQLAEKMQVVYFDLRGQGRSARGDPRRYTLDENVEDLEALRQYIGLGAIVSVGTSYGGMVAMAHAARYPDAVSHLIVVGTASHGGFISRAMSIVSELGSRDQVSRCSDLFAGRLDTPEKFRDFLEVMGPLYSRKHDAASFRAALDRSILCPEPLNRAFAPTGFLRQFDLRAELRSIRAPTLILAGRHDWICAPEFSEEIRGLIPGSDLRIFEDSSHFIAADEPEAFLDAIVGWLVYKRHTQKVGNCESTVQRR